MENLLEKEFGISETRKIYEPGPFYGKLNEDFNFRRYMTNKKINYHPFSVDKNIRYIAIGIMAITIMVMAYMFSGCCPCKQKTGESFKNAGIENRVLSEER